MKTRALILACGAALGVVGGMSSLAAAATTVTKTSGSGTVSGTTITTTAAGQRIKFTGSSTASITVVVEVDTPTEIDLIEVEVNKASTAIAQVQLIVRAKPGSAGKVQRVGSVRQISADGTADGELIIENITTDLDGLGGGNIGGRGTTRAGEIRAPIIGTINAAGHVTANIIATGRSGGGQSNINYVNILNGSSLYGNLTASTGVVGFVSISGNVGATIGSIPVQPSIYARDGIRKVTCENFYGTLSSPVSTTTGNLQRLEVNNLFAGSIDVQNLTIVDPAETLRGIVIGGDLTGTMNFRGGLISTLTVGGALIGQVNSAGVASDRPASDPDRDTDISIGSFAPSGRFTTTGNIAGPFTIAGPLQGTLTVGTMGSNILLAAPISCTGVTGLLTVHGQVMSPHTINVSGELSPGGRIHIGGALNGGISLPPDGLKGEVYINGDLLVPSGAWSGTVTVGGVPITAPANGEYAALPDDLGGGVLATAPFRLHREASVPSHDSSTPMLANRFVLGQPNSEVRIVSYGPMVLDAGASDWIDAVRIQREEPEGSCNWVDAEQGFNVSLTDFVDTREIILTPSGLGIPMPGKYRVVTDLVRCKGVPGNPLVVWPAACGTGANAAPNGAYVFRVGVDCNNDGQPDAAPGPSGLTPVNGLLEDTNNNGVPDDCEAPACPPQFTMADFDDSTNITVADLFGFLDAWFAQNGSCTGGGGGGPGTCSADADNSGGVDVTDLFSFLDAWFAFNGTDCQ